MEKLEKYNESLFEDIIQYDEEGNEYWSARDLMHVLGYDKWERFHGVIKKAMESCKASNYEAEEHFPGAGKVLNVGNNAAMEVKDYHLTRYACYLIAQNGDSRKETIAMAQTYFAVQTRKYEVLSDDNLTEDEKRLVVRSQTRSGNYKLNQTAKRAGVKNFDKFHNAGYKGLYNGETADDIAKRKNLRYREEILDHMGSEELAANWFRITQTDAKLKREKIQGEDKANNTHYEMGKAIREFISEQGGTMPEDLPTPKKSIKELEKERNNLLEKI